MAEEDSTGLQTEGGWPHCSVRVETSFYPAEQNKCKVNTGLSEEQYLGKGLG